MNFSDLPLDVHDHIVEKIVYNLPPKDRIQFAKTSKYSNWLVQRVKPKKIIHQLIYDGGFQYALLPNSPIILCDFELLTIIDNCEIQKFRFSTIPFMKGNFEGKFYEATQFISQLEITLKGYPDLKADDNFSTFLDHFPVVEMLKIEDDPWSEKSRTALLKILADKTEVWQLSFIHFDYESSLEDLIFFLQNATFLDGTMILLKTRLKDIIQMITFFGNWRSKTVYTLPGFINDPRSAVLLNENIKIIPKENNNSLTGIYLIPDILDHYPEHTWANHGWNY